MKQRILNLLIALDQLIYVVITLGVGMPDETMSAAAYRMELAGKPAGVFRQIIDALLWFDVDHCHQAYLSEAGKKQLPREYQ